MKFDKQVGYTGNHFARCLDDYSSVGWQFAWAREAGQNSIDAGATRVDISVDFDGEHTIVRWEDNGIGMSADTAENVLMMVGGTLKPLGGVGGKGAAKIILFFAHNSYWYHSRDVKVWGEGGNYRLETNQPHQRGMLLEVKVEGDQSWEIREGIKEWVRWTTSDCEFYLGEYQLDTLPKKRAKRALEWCSIGSHPDVRGSHRYQVRVRSGGQFMFGVNSSIPGGIVIDLKGDSRKILNTNRDSLDVDYKEKLTLLIEEIFTDPSKITSAEDHTTLYKGTEGKLRLKKAPEGEAPRKKIKFCNPEELLAALNGPGRQLVPDPWTEPSDKELEKLIDGYDIVISNRTSKEIPKKWLPGTMNRACYKLLNRWTELARVCGGILGRREDIRVGFVFSQTERAMHKRNNELGHCLLVNPVEITDTRFLNYWKDSNESFYEMVAVCVHELVHLDHNYHNESYAIQLTDSMGKVLNHQKLLNRVRKETR